MAIIDTQNIRLDDLEQVFRICGMRLGKAALERKVSDYVIEHSPEIARFLLDMEKYNKPRLQGSPGSDKNVERMDKPGVNYFAPEKILQEMLCEDWFDAVCTEKRLYPPSWRRQLITDLMASDYRDEIAMAWSKPEQRLQVKGHVIGALTRCGVLLKNKLAVARVFLKTTEDTKEAKTLSKYMGNKTYYALWIEERVKGPIENS